MMSISKYGIKPLLVIASLCLIFTGILYFVNFNLLWPLTILPLLFFIFSLNFFRSPLPPGPKDSSIVYSPANGKVVEVIENANEAEYIKGPVWKITIFLNVFDVHVNSSPVAGEIEYVNFVLGKKLNALDPRSSIENEYALIGVKTESGIRLAVRQIAGLIARRIICDVKKGDKVEQCGVVGMIRFGSRAEICIPKDANFSPLVKVGDKVLCGVSPLGQFKK